MRSPNETAQLLDLVQNLNFEETRKLLKRNPNLIHAVYNEYNPDGTAKSDFTILYHAAKMGNLEMCNLLLSHGANAKAGVLNPVIFGAIESNNPAVVKLMIDHGASAKQRSRLSPNLTALEFAESLNNAKISNILAKSSEIDSSYLKEAREETPFLFRKPSATKLSKEEIGCIIS